MQILAICCLLAVLGLVLWGVLRDWWPRPSYPLCLQVEDDVENIEWLLISLLKAAPRLELIIVDHTLGENKQILKALARRYHIQSLAEAPPGLPLLQARKGVDPEQLLAQYRALATRA